MEKILKKKNKEHSNEENFDEKIMMKKYKKILMTIKKFFYKFFLYT